MRAPRLADIPIVDVAPLLRGEACRETARALRDASQDPGFIYVANHGIDASTIDAAHSSAKEFFASNEEVKRRVAISEHHRGWLRAGEAKMAKDVPTDSKESFVWGRTFDTDLRDHPLRGPNRWPALEHFQHNAMAWFDAAEQLAVALLGGVATSLELDADFFLRNIERPLSRASFVHYGVREPIDQKRFGVGPHTDFGVLTILCQDSVGGLEIKTPGGDWLAATPIDGTLIVNVGDLLERWTNGAFRSAPHRVLSPSTKDRLSLVLAFDPNPETLIDGRNINTGDEVLEPVSCGDYLTWRFEQAFAYRRQGERL